MRDAAGCFVMFLLLILGIPSLFLAFWVFMSGPEKQRYALDGVEFELVNAASDYVDEYVRAKGVLPTYSEFKNWAKFYEKKNPEYRLEGRGVSLQKSGFSDDLIDVFGAPKKNGYVISFWNGDNTVRVPSWGNDRWAAYISDEDYFGFESKTRAVLSYLAIPLFLLLLSIADHWQMKKADARKSLNMRDSG